MFHYSCKRHYHPSCASRISRALSPRAAQVLRSQAHRPRPASQPTRYGTCASVSAYRETPVKIPPLPWFICLKMLVTSCRIIAVPCRHGTAMMAALPPRGHDCQQYQQAVSLTHSLHGKKTHLPLSSVVSSRSASVRSHTGWQPPDMHSSQSTVPGIPQINSFRRWDYLKLICIYGVNTTLPALATQSTGMQAGSNHPVDTKAKHQRLQRAFLLERST